MAKVRKIDSACTSVSFAVEYSIGQLPDSGVKWYPLAVNSYGEFGATIESVSDEPIGSGRAPLKGSPVRKTVSAGFEVSLRQRNVQRFLPGFVYNLGTERGTTDEFYIRSVGSTVLSSVQATTFTCVDCTVAKGWDIPAGGSLLVVGQGFRSQKNNGLHVVTARTDTTLTTTGLSPQLNPQAGAEVNVCGMRYASGANVTYAADDTEITIVADGIHEGDFAEMKPGEFLFLGSDVADQALLDAGSPAVAIEGFVRIKEVLTGSVKGDLTTFTPRSAAAAGKADIYVPTRSFWDSTECGDDRRTTFQFERKLGKADDTNPYDQTQVIKGAVANELTLSVPSADKVTVSMAFPATDSERRHGQDAAHKPLSDGLLQTTAEDRGAMYNTSYDIQELALYVPSATDTTAHLARRIIGYVTECTLTINNNATPIEGIGVFGAIDVNAGVFNVTGSITALFTDIAAINAVEDNLDAGFLMIAARKNAGIVVDIPLLTLSSASLSLENNTPVTISIDSTANRSDLGHSVMLSFFDYLPKAAYPNPGKFNPYL